MTMRVVPRAPASFQETTAFRKLALVSDSDGLQAKASRFLDAAIPVLDSIATGPFRYYTLHNRDHAKKVLHLAEHILHPTTVDQLTSFEWLLLIYSACLHDMGLAVSAREIETTLDSSEYQEYLRDNPVLLEAVGRKRAELAVLPESQRPAHEVDLADLHIVGLTGFLRPSHAKPDRYRTIIRTLRSALSGDDPFSIRGVSFEDELIEICASHNLSATVLADIHSAHRERFPRHLVVADHQANMQFIASVLRLSDILDCDFERTPRVLFDNLGIRDRGIPGAEVSLQEWERHLAVQQLEIFDDELVLRATSHHPVIEATINAFAREIEKEVRDTTAILRRNPQDVGSQYQLAIPVTVRADVRSRGYVYMDLAVRLDEAAVTALLMGTRLYPTRYAAVRELIQNGLDACAIRQHVEGSTIYRPQVEVADSTDGDGVVWLVVRDNGIGMSQDVLRDHFFRVGSSYYSSSGFERMLRSRHLERIPVISRFGIGFLSVFMLGSAVDIETRRAVALGDDSTGWRVRVQQHGALAYVQRDNSLPEGTTVRVRLDPSGEATDGVLDKIVGYLRENVLRPPIGIDVRLRDVHFRLSPRVFTEALPEGAATRAYGAIAPRLRTVRIDSEQYTNLFSGPIFLVFATNPPSTDLDIKLDGKPMAFYSTAQEHFRLDPKLMFADFGGTRITVAGFRMTMKRLSALLRRGRSAIPAVYDLDFKPSPIVDFDVTRTKIRDEAMELRSQIRDVILKGLKAQNIFEMLSESAKSAAVGREVRVEWGALRSDEDLIDDESLLERVADALPPQPWGVGVHGDVAGRLGISRGLAYKALSTLIATGRVPRPQPIVIKRI
jgi:hypothetical protein